MEKQATAIKIMNDALIATGNEAKFDYRIKNLLILIIDFSIRKGYKEGYFDGKNNRKAKTDCINDVNDFGDLIKKYKSRK